MKKFGLMLLITTLFVACSSQFIELPISDFNMDNTGIQSGEEVEFITFSGSDNHKPPYKSFVHFIMVSKTTGDTFNLLTILGAFPPLDEENKPVGIFQSVDSWMGQSLFNYENLFKTSYKDIDKVVIDRMFQSDAKNDYPTVIGVLAQKG